MANVSSSNGLEKRPKLRFPGFDEPWQSTLLSSVFTKNTKKNTDGQITNVICNSAKQGLIPQREYFDKDIANSDNTSGYYIIEENDFVYNPRKSADAPYGPISRYKYAEAGIVSPLYLCFRAKKEINPSFFEWYFRSSAWHRYVYMSGDSGARHDRVSIKDDTFFAMPINLPSAHEQEHIASFLERIDQRIEKQRALVESLKKYKRGLLRAYFGTDNWKSQGTWSKCKLGACCSKIGSGKTPKGGSSVYANQGIMFLRSQNVLWGTLDISEVSFIDEATNSTMQSSEVRFGDVLLNITGASIGRSCIYTSNDRANVNQHVCIIRLSQESKERLLPEFLLQQILSDRIQQQVMDCQNGGSREGLNFQQIADFNIVIPEMEEQRKICGMLKAFDQKLCNEEISLKALFSLRTSLMQQLFI